MLIGITGLKTSGKDTCADYICQTRGAVKFSFAEPLKNGCKHIFGLTDEQVNGDLKEVPDERWFGVTPRKILQFVGTELFRTHLHELNENFGNDFWVKCMENRIAGLDKQIVVIPDVRFENELQMVKKYNGKVIRIIRPGLEQMDMHESELGCNKFDVDYEIRNDGSIEDLYAAVDHVLAQV